LIIDNYPADQKEEFDVPDFPQDPENSVSRKVPFGRVIFIERSDFEETPPPKYFRLSPGREVRLMNAYHVTCTDIVKDDQGNLLEIHCNYDPETRGGMSPDGRKVKGTIHWVAEEHAINAECRLYEQMFAADHPEDLPEGETFMDYFDPQSKKALIAKLEPSLADAKVGEVFQFVRNGYFTLDSEDSKPGALVFNRTIGLVDSWAKMHK